ncbi:MAG: hypothetical protein QM753_11310 [Thermomicrobiales bacterium]
MWGNAGAGMRIKLDLVEIDFILDRKLYPGFSGDRNGFTALGGRLRYQKLLAQQGASGDDSSLVGIDPFNMEMRRILGAGACGRRVHRQRADAVQRHARRSAPAGCRSTRGTAWRWLATR